VNGLAHAIERVIEDRTLAADLRRRGLERSLRFDWQETAARTLAFYRKVLGR
jgi:glycosyltransferase involved in cell wall biosynthesis